MYIYMACNGVLTPATKTNLLRVKPQLRKFSNHPAQWKYFLTALQRFLRELI